MGRENSLHVSLLTSQKCAWEPTCLQVGPQHYLRIVATGNIVRGLCQFTVFPNLRTSLQTRHGEQAYVQSICPEPIGQHAQSPLLTDWTRTWTKSRGLCQTLCHFRLLEPFQL